MKDLTSDMLPPRRPTADRPLLGQTVLLVEDSRHAGETMRLMCLRGGARIRRADSLRSAGRHLTSYSPSVVIVDLGLPDGSGLDLIRQLAMASPRVAVILATSGDPTLERSAEAAGADAFLCKPFGSVAAFQAAILLHLPEDARPRGPRAVPDDTVNPDPAALQDDLALIVDLLDADVDRATLAYALSFAQSIARAVSDDALAERVAQVQFALDHGRPILAEISSLAAEVQSRLGVVRMVG